MSSRKFTQSERIKMNRSKRAAQKRLAQSLARIPPRDVSNVRVGGFQNIEFKFLDTTKASTVVAATGTVLNDTLCAIPEGAGESSRVGRKVSVTKLDIRGWVQLANGTNEAQTDLIRIIVYLDKQSNGAAATTAQLLETTDYLAFRNLENKDRFRVLHDYTMEFNRQAAAYDGTTDQYAAIKHNFFLSKKFTSNPIILQYSASTPSVADLTSNNIGVIAITESGLASIQYVARLRYTDN